MKNIKPAFFFFLPLVIAFFPNCKNSKINAYKESENKETQTLQGFSDTIPRIIIDDQLTPDSFGARFSIDTVIYNKSKSTHGASLLEIRVKYSGGCREHDFNLFSDKRYMKSMPPQLHLVLVHNNNNDHCRNIVNKMLYFNIEEIKYEKQKKLLLLINDYPHKIEYLY